MYTRIIVALDGSELAERVLPYVEALAEKFGSAVILLRATAPPEVLAASAAGTGPPLMPADRPMPVDPTPIIEAERQEAASYLGMLAGRLRRRGLAVTHEHHEGLAADVIVARARESRAALIAMTTHGRGGLGRLLFGSTADAVLRHAPCPVLLVRVSDEDTGER
jgi:nucleotide-binding universal stress UspA family protein